MIQAGSIVEAFVIDENETHYFVQTEGQTFALDKKQVDEKLQADDFVEGMVYENRFKKAVIQLDLPDIRPGIYGWGEVVDVQHGLGVFVDVGLIDKDIVVSLDDLPEDKDLWPRRGDKLYLTFESDKKNQLWGKLADENEISKNTRKAKPVAKNYDINAHVVNIKDVGETLITEDNFFAFLHESERYEPLRLGQSVQGRVIDVHRDGRVNISLKPRAHEAIDDDSKMLLKILERTPDGFLPYHDYSDAGEIRNMFGISKSQFKRAVGNLMKNGYIKQVHHEGIYLNKDDE